MSGTNAQGVSYIGSSLSTALKMKPYVEQQGFDGKDFVNLVMRELQDLGMPGLGPKTPLKVSSDKAVPGTQLVGTVQNSELTR